MSTTNAKTQNTASARFSRDWMRITLLTLVVVGLVVSGYLSYTRLFATSVQCIGGGAFDCDAVSNSSYSKLLGIPVAYLGFGTYALLGVVLLAENRVGFLRDYGTTLVLAIALFSFLFSLWLVYVQVFRLEALCVWCLTHEVVITIFFVIAALRLRRSLTP